MPMSMARTFVASYLLLLYRYMRPLIDAGQVCRRQYHRFTALKTVGGGGKKGEFVYTYSDDEMKKITGELTKAWKEVERTNPSDTKV
jgi:DNA gyrase subunit B